MRTVDANLIAQMTASRQMNARLTLRDNRLVFGQLANPTWDSAVASATSIDGAVYGSGILRVANVAGVIWYQWVPNPATTPWPAWAASSIQCHPDCKIGLYQNRAFYQSRDESSYPYNIYYADWSGSAWSGGYKVASTIIGYVAALAPISTTQFYALLQHPGDQVYGYLHYHNTVNSGSPFNEWPGLIYTGGANFVKAFDAERLGSDDYILFTDFDGKRVMQLRHTYGSFNGSATSSWGDVVPVIPMDIVDDMSQFRLSGATVIDNQLVVTGSLVRANGPRMHVYLFGPEHYSMGRDLFLCTATGNEEAAPSLGGKLFLIDNTLYYVSRNHLMRADATSLVGVDNANHKLVTSDFSKIEASYEPNQPSRLMVDLKSGLAHSSIRPGTDVTVEAGYGGYYAALGTFGLDAVPSGYEEAGETLSLIGRGTALRRLAQWKADCDFDYWSQGKKAAYISALEDVVRVSGDWQENLSDGGLELRDLNTEGVYYSTVRASRGGFAQGCFWHPGNMDDILTTRYGLIVQYYRETKQAAADRLKIKLEKVTDADYGWSGIAVVAKQGTDATAIEVHVVRNGTWTLQTSATLNIPDGTWHWLAADFYEGSISVFYRLDTSTTWTKVIDAHKLYEGVPVWGRGEVGRVGLYAQNITPYSTSYSFGTESKIVPVESNAIFPASVHSVKVDQEVIRVSGKSGNTGLLDQTVSTGYTVNDPETDAPRWSNTYKDSVTWPDTKYEVYLAGTMASMAPSTYENYALVITEGTGKGACLRITHVDYVAPEQWQPSQTYNEPDNWTDHIGEDGHGEWIASGMWRVFVEEEVAGIIGPGSKVDIRPALIVTQRGYASTRPTPHGGSLCSRFQGNAYATCSRIKVFTGEPDMSWEWMAEEIARKAGVLKTSPEKLLSGTVNHTGWGLTSPVTRAQFVMRFRPISGTEMGVGFNFTEDGQYGYILTITATALNYYNVEGGTRTLVEAIPLPSAPAGWITLSWDEDYASVWVNRRLVGSFFCFLTGTVGHQCGIVSNGACSVEVDWPALDMRVDNFILDMGKPGLSILTDLIGQRRIFLQETADGTLRLFRSRADVNTSGTAYALAYIAGKTRQDAEMITRARVQGIVEAERFDANLMAQYGNLFSLIEAEELESSAEIREEANLVLEDAGRSAEITTFQGALDPRLEPNDFVYLNVRGTVTHLLVDALSIDIHLTDQEALMDMEIECRNG